jgi:ankyrin repeat protein
LVETLGCDINAQNHDNDTPIHLALSRFNSTGGGDITALTYLLTQKNVNVTTKNQHGETLLHNASKNINEFPLDVFKLLVEIIGCDINAQDKSNNTPIHIALRVLRSSYVRDMTILTYLLSQKSINVHIKSEYGFTLLHWLCSCINTLPIAVFKSLIG